MRAVLRDYNQSPRKVRLVARLVAGKPVSYAMTQLSFLPKRAAAPLRKLIASAVANAKQNNGVLSESKLVIKEIRVDKGMVLKRYRPAARGAAHAIRKKRSHVFLTLAEPPALTSTARIDEPRLVEQKKGNIKKDVNNKGEKSN